MNLLMQWIMTQNRFKSIPQMRYFRRVRFSTSDTRTSWLKPGRLQKKRRPQRAGLAFFRVTRRQCMLPLTFLTQLINHFQCKVKKERKSPVQRARIYHQPRALSIAIPRAPIWPVPMRLQQDRAKVNRNHRCPGDSPARRKRPALPERERNADPI